MSDISSPGDTLTEAVARHQAGDLAAAKRLYLSVLDHQPDQPDALHLLGVIAQQDGDIPAALDLFDRALAAQPDMALAHFNKANTLRDAGRAEEAIGAYRQALAHAPDYLDAALNLGALLHDQGQVDQAADLFEDLVARHPGDARTHYNRGKCLHAQGHLEDAGQALAKAQELDPAFADAHFARANLCDDMGNPNAAIAHIQNALKLNPKWPEAFMNWGNYLCSLDRRRESLDKYRQALELAPDYTDATVNMAYALLTLGRLREGWSAYSRRFESSKYEKNKQTWPYAVWNGEDLEGRTLLLWTEQGLGDEIIYSSFLTDILGKTRACTLICSDRMVPIFKRSFPTLDVIGRAAAQDTLANRNYDYHSALADLGPFLRPDVNAFPPARPFLKADAEVRASLREKYKKTAGGRPLIGISWASENPEIGHWKSVPLPEWQHILKKEEYKFYNLQYGQSASTGLAHPEIAKNLLTDPEIDPVTHPDDALAQIAAMDLIITVSNSTAHMAGALGQPVWILAPRGKAQLWYWFENAETTAWYPKARIIRQESANSWDGLMAILNRRLDSLSLQS